jgi:hypothetical protein
VFSAQDKHLRYHCAPLTDQQMTSLDWCASILQDLCTMTVFSKTQLFLHNPSECLIH